MTRHTFLGTLLLIMLSSEAYAGTYDILEPELSDEQLQMQQADVTQVVTSFLDTQKSRIVGTQDDITLPIFDGVTMMMPYQGGMKIGELKTLPIVTFNANGNLASVLKFYQKTIPTFEINYQPK